IAIAVHRDAIPGVIPTAAEIGGPDERTTAGELRHEGVESPAAEAALRRVQQREPDGTAANPGGDAGDVGVAAAVHRDASASVLPAAAEVSGPDARARARVLGHEGIKVPAKGALRRVQHRKVAIRPAHDVGIAATVHGDASALVLVANAEIGGPGDRR